MSALKSLPRPRVPSGRKQLDFARRTRVVSQGLQSLASWRSHLMKIIFSLVLAALVIAIAPAEERLAKPVNGHNLDGWKFRGDAAKSKWKATIAALDPKDAAKIIASPDFADSRGLELVNTEGHSVDIFTEAKYGDCIVETEV